MCGFQWPNATFASAILPYAICKAHFKNPHMTGPARSALFRKAAFSGSSRRTTRRPYTTHSRTGVNDYKVTDWLYIHLSSKPSAVSKEISAGIVLDYDADGDIVRIDSDNASRKIDPHEIILSKIPAEAEALIA